MITQRKRFPLALGLVLLLLNIAGPARLQGLEEGWQIYTAADGLPSNQVWAIAQDGGGRSWFGTNGSGAGLLDDGGTPFDKKDDTWITFTAADGLAGDYVYAVVEDSGGRLWFGADGGVSVLDDGGTPFDEEDDVWTTFTTADGLAEGSVQSIAIDGGDRLWFGTRTSSMTGQWYGYASVLDDGGTPFDKGDDAWITFTTADGLADGAILAVAIDGEGRLWFGAYGLELPSRGGVSVLDGGGTPFDKGDDVWATFTTADGLAHNWINAIAMDGGGRLWFGTYGGVSVLDGGGTPFDEGDDAWITFTAADGLADNQVKSIAVDNRERLWFGTYGGGVSVLDDGETLFEKGDDVWISFTTADGLASNVVETIASDGERWWFGTRGGGVGELVDALAPASSASSPAHVTSGAIPVSWSASDGASGIFGATLWAKYGSDGAWTETESSQQGASDGTFYYTPGQSDGIYYFAAVAEDWMGNVQIAPSGSGDCWTRVGISPVYIPLILHNRVAYAAPCGLANDYCEDYDSYDVAYGPLEPGLTYQAHPEDERDYYYFVARTTESVIVRVADYSALGWLVVRKDDPPDLTPIGWDERKSGQDTILEVILSNLSPGRYYVQIHTSADYSAATLYTLKLIK
jgi:hypothetical protein